MTLRSPPPTPPTSDSVLLLRMIGDLLRERDTVVARAYGISRETLYQYLRASDDK